MGNLRGYAGPLPQSYIDDQAGASVMLVRDICFSGTAVLDVGKKGCTGRSNKHPNALSRAELSWANPKPLQPPANGLYMPVIDVTPEEDLQVISVQLMVELFAGAALQRRILARMRSFGMTPVFPAFAGFVPAALTAQRPHLNIVRQGFL